jgi:hypothetical protein
VKNCACGSPKHHDDVVCMKCWGAASLELRQRFTPAAAPGLRRELARKLITFARTRRPVVVPQPKQANLFPV